MLREIKGSDSNEFAVVLKLHRDDIERCGIPKEVCDKIDDGLLCEIAEKVGEALLDLGFWESLETVVKECVELPEVECPEEGEVEDGGDICIRCGLPIDHDNTHNYCSTCFVSQ